jgi:hypothetical protein
MAWRVRKGQNGSTGERCRKRKTTSKEKRMNESAHAEKNDQTREKRERKTWWWEEQQRETRREMRDRVGGCRAKGLEDQTTT